MQIELSPDALRLAQAAVDAGRFPSIADAVNEAALSLEEQELDEALCAALQEAEDDIEHGRIHPFTPELLEELTREAIADSKTGKPIDPNVLP